MQKRYSCNRCGFSAHKKSNITDHLNIKKQCKGTEEAKVMTKEHFKCEDCDEDVAYNGIKKHAKICKKQKPHTTIYNNNTNTNNSNNTTNNITNNIICVTLNATETPSTDHIDKIIAMIEARLPDLYKKIYFDKTVPQNHCILYTPEHEKNRTVGIIIGENKNFTDIKEEKFLNEIETSISLAQDRIIEKFPEDQQFDMYKKATEVYKARKTDQVINERNEFLKIAKDNHQMVINTSMCV